LGRIYRINDGDFLIHSNSLKAGIEFIKTAGLEIDITDTKEEIISLRNTAIDYLIKRYRNK